MKITYMEALECVESLRQLMDMPLPAAASIRMVAIAKKIESALEMYHDQRMKIAHEFALKDEDGNTVYTDDKKTSIKINPERQDECNAELQTLLNLETEDDFNPLLASMVSSVTITPKLLFGMGKLFQDSET